MAKKAPGSQSNQGGGTSGGGTATAAGGGGGSGTGGGGGGGGGGGPDLDLEFPVPVASLGTGLPVAAPRGKGAAPAQNRVQNALQQILGRAPRTADPRSFVSALRQSFTPQAVGSHTEFAWNPQSFVGNTDLGGSITGAQAAIYATAAANLERCLPLLDGLYSLKPEADLEEVESARSLVRQSVIDIVNNLKSEGGPNVDFVDFTFLRLVGETAQGKDGQPLVNPPASIGAPSTPKPPSPDSPGGHLGTLKRALFLFDDVATIDEENNRTAFISFVDFVFSTQQSWNTFRKTVVPGDDGKFPKLSDLGTKLIKVSRLLSASAESVREFNAAADFVFVGESERQVALFFITELKAGEKVPALDPLTHTLTLPGKLVSSVSVADLLTWIDDFVTSSGPGTIQNAGVKGLDEVAVRAKRLSNNVAFLLAHFGAIEVQYDGGAKTLGVFRELPRGLRRNYVKRCLEDLQVQLSSLADVAGI